MEHLEKLQYYASSFALDHTFKTAPVHAVTPAADFGATGCSSATNFRAKVMPHARTTVASRKALTRPAKVKAVKGVLEAQVN